MGKKNMAKLIDYSLGRDALFSEHLSTKAITELI